MCVALTVVDGIELPCRMQSDGLLCYYHQKVADRLLTPSDRVSQVRLESGRILYGSGKAG